MKPTQYHIKTIADFSNVPDRLLSQCLREFTKTVLAIRSQRPNTGMDINEFTWIADGIDSIKSLVLPDGEVVENPHFPKRG